jgi:signal transduction histidine kinase
MTEPIVIVVFAVLLGVIAYLGVRLRAEQARTSPAPRPPARRRSPSHLDEAPARQILERIEDGVLLLDGGLKPLLANGAARSMLGLQQGPLPRRIPSAEVLTVAREARRSDGGADRVIRTWFPRRASLWVRASPLEEHEGLVVILRDVTEELQTKQIRREFVAHASHELKSPVAGMQALAESVKGAAGRDPEVARRFADQLAGEAARIGRLIGDLLDLSKLEEATEQPSEPVHLSEVARHAAAELRGEAEEREMTLEVDVTPKIWVRGDEHQLSVMIRNLLENAIRYTPEGGRVSLAVSRDNSRVVVVVADDGMGIPLDAQSRVFERFYRVDRARSRARGGTGLGLAIVKHVVELHGGSVALDSELGRGSTFTVTLPAPAGADERDIRSMAG